MLRVQHCLVLPLILIAACSAAEPTTTTVDFEVSEGTNLAFDISPDGETLVFDLLGQLWSVSADGGRARPLTDAVRDTAEDLDPAFSPDGRWIAFQSDRPRGSGLWLIPVDGSGTRRLTDDGPAADLPASVVRYGIVAHLAPDWSPDGTEIVYALPDALFRLDVESGASVTIPIEPPADVGALSGLGSPDWSPDGQRIAFGSGQGGAFRYRLGGTARIWEVGKDGGTATPVTPEGVRAVAPAYSPDGARIAFFAPDSLDRWQLWVQTGPGSPATQLTDHDDTTIRRARWSPDGSEIFYSANGRLWRIAAAGGPAREIPFTVRVRFERQRPALPAVRFAEPGTEQAARGFMGLALSPNGGQIALVAVGRLWVSPVDGSPRAVAEVPEGAEGVSWSPDGGEVLFTAGDIFAADVGTGATRRLTAFAGAAPVRGAEWSPDGGSVAFTHDGRLRLHRLADGVAQELAATVDLGPATLGEATRPLWRSDSGALLTYGQRGNAPPTATLVSVDGESRVLGRAPPGATHLQWPKPDTLVFSHGNRLWTAGLDAASGMIGEPTVLSDEPALFVSAAANGAILYVSDDGLRLREPGGGVRTIGWPVTYDVPEAPRPLLLRNVRLIDGTGTPAAPGRDLLIEDGRIARIAPAGALEPPVGASVVDAAGRTVIPGLIDLHRHLIEDYFEASRQVAGALYHGTTTLRDTGSDIGQTAALRDLVAAGVWPGARVVLGGYIFQGLEIGGGHAGPINQYVTGDDQLARGVAIARAFGAEYVKHRGTYGNWASWVATIREAHRHGMRTSGHCSSILPAVAAGVDGQEHSGSCLRDTGVIYEDYARLKAEAGLWVTVNGITGTNHPAFDPAIPDRPDIDAFLVGATRARFRYWQGLSPAQLEGARANNERVFAPRRARARRLHASGVPLAIGYDDYLPTGSHSVLEALVVAGLSPLEAITAGTANAARALGAEGEIGTLEVGKLADLLILDADPLEDIRNTKTIWMVIKGGRLVDRDALLDRARAIPAAAEQGAN